MTLKRLMVAFASLCVFVGMLASPASAHGGDREALNWWDGSPVGGGSATDLDRDDAEVKVQIRDLPGGHAVTVWAVIFEHPENCDAADAVIPGMPPIVLVSGSPGCGEDDVVRAFLDPPADDTGLTVTFAAGGVTNPAGNLRLRNQIGGGDTLIGDGTFDERDGAEVHFVVRSHGPDQEGDADTTTFAGGCVDGDLPPGTVPTEVGDCADVQFSVHLAG